MITSRRMRWVGHVELMGRRMPIGYWWERDHYEDQDVGVWIIIKWILRQIVCEGMDWIDLAQDRGQRRAPVNTVMKFRVP
jgi:hypothetical protein